MSIFWTIICLLFSELMIFFQEIVNAIITSTSHLYHKCTHMFILCILCLVCFPLYSRTPYSLYPHLVEYIQESRVPPFGNTMDSHPSQGRKCKVVHLWHFNLPVPSSCHFSPLPYHTSTICSLSILPSRNNFHAYVLSNVLT